MQLQRQDTDVSIHLLPEESKGLLLGKLLNIHLDENSLDLYFQYYAEQCETARHERGRNYSVRTFQDILQLAKRLQDPHKTREQVVSTILGRCDPTTNYRGMTAMERIQNSVDLVARLITMMNFGDPPGSFGPECSKLEWKQGSLKDFIAKYLSEQKLADEHVRLEKAFNLQNIERVAGIKIKWTDNLADHLRLMEDNAVLLFFHHATFLENNNR